MTEQHTAKSPAEMVLAEEEAYEKVITPIEDKFEPKLKGMNIPKDPTPGEIRELVWHIDQLDNDVQRVLREAKTVYNKLKDTLEYKRAEFMIDSKEEMATEKREDAKARLLAEGFVGAYHLAEAKYNYLCSVEDRLRRKKELLNIDRAAGPGTSHPSSKGSIKR